MPKRDGRRKRLKAIEKELVEVLETLRRVGAQLEEDGMHKEAGTKTAARVVDQLDEIQEISYAGSMRLDPTAEPDDDADCGPQESQDGPSPLVLSVLQRSDFTTRMLESNASSVDQANAAEALAMQLNGKLSTDKFGFDRTDREVYIFSDKFDPSEAYLEWRVPMNQIHFEQEDE